MNFVWKAEIFPELMELSPGDRKEVWAACKWKAFRHKQAWFALFSYVPLTALALLGMKALWTYSTAWQDDLPYFGWSSFILLFEFKALGLVAGLTANWIITATTTPLTQPYIDAYIHDHNIVKAPYSAPPAPILKMRQFLATALYIILYVSFYIAAGASWNSKVERDFWETSVSQLGTLAGSLQADKNFRAGRKRLYEIVSVPIKLDEDQRMPKSKFTGRRNGNLEIWTRPSYKLSGEPGEMSDKIFVDAYNNEMIRLEKRGLPSIKPLDRSSR